jgi:hypothetical protein
LPGGFKLPRPGFGYINNSGVWWSSSYADLNNANSLTLMKINGGFVDCCKYDKLNIHSGASVRCIK